MGLVRVFVLGLRGWGFKFSPLHGAVTLISHCTHAPVGNSTTLAVDPLRQPHQWHPSYGSHPRAELLHTPMPQEPGADVILIQASTTHV